MGAKCNGGHFKVECKIDGVWFENGFVFPDRGSALEFKQREESYGSGNEHRIVPTNAAVNLPAEEEGESPEDGDSPSPVDWCSLFELSVLCPVSFRGAGDGDLERVYARYQQGCRIEGRVFF